MDEARTYPAPQIDPVMISLAGHTLDDEEKAMLELPFVGGVILFARNYHDREQLKNLIAAVKTVNPTCVIAIDHEGGRVQRLREGFTPIPPAAAFGYLYDREPEQAKQLAYACGSLIADELRRIGIDLNFSPVLDINTGSSAVIGDRAFHSSPEAISELAEAFIKGLHNGGMLSVGKHYPGHGFIKADTHTRRGTDPRTREQIEQSDILPYKHLIEKDLLDAVMTAHIVYPEVDDKPATLSARWLNDILCNELRFEGVIFSDDLSMQGIGQFLKNKPVKDILAANCNVLLVCNDRDLIRRVIQELSAADIQSEMEQYRNEAANRWQKRMHLLNELSSADINYQQTAVALQKLTAEFNDSL